MKMFGVMDLSSGFDGCRFAIGVAPLGTPSARGIGLRRLASEGYSPESGISGGEATLGLTLTAVFQNKGDDAVAGDSRAESGDLIVVENTLSDRRWDERLQRLQRPLHVLSLRRRVAGM
jgi:hypothetical protein